MDKHLTLAAVVLIVALLVAAPVGEGVQLNEELNAHDETLWVMGEWGFGNNACAMRQENVLFADSLMTLWIKRAKPRIEGKEFTGGGYSSKRLYGHGWYHVRMKSDIRQGTVSSFFLMNPWQEKDWIQQEIDIEFLGKDPSVVQFTVHYFPQGGKHLHHSKAHELGFDSNEAFHDYSIHWTKDLIEWYVDGVKAHTETRDLPVCDGMNIMMNHWVPDPDIRGNVHWVGEMNRRKLPSSAVYDWIRFTAER